MNWVIFIKDLKTLKYINIYKIWLINNIIKGLILKELKMLIKFITLIILYNIIFILTSMQL